MTMLKPGMTVRYKLVDGRTYEPRIARDGAVDNEENTMSTAPSVAQVKEDAI